MPVFYHFCEQRGAKIKWAIRRGQTFGGETEKGKKEEIEGGGERKRLSGALAIFCPVNKLM